jgi:hypothetical protein
VSEVVEEKLIMSSRRRAETHNSLSTKHLPVAQTEAAPIGMEKNNGELALFVLLPTNILANSGTRFAGKLPALQAIFNKK